LYFVLPPQIGLTVLLCVALAAILKGGLEERIVVAGLLANIAVTVLLRIPSGRAVQWAGFAADVLFLLLIVVVALRSAKFWPLAAAAFQLLATITHVAKFVDPNVNRWAYFTAIIIWTYALLIALGVGVWNSWRSRAYLANAGPASPGVETRR
jgi:hypothetical protein